MIAVDTNILVRLVTGDDLAQTKIAEGLFETEAVWIGKTVLLETAWVLQRVYSFGPDAVTAALRGLLGLSNVSVEDSHSVQSALGLTAAGIEFADALHLSSRPAELEFVTFDRKFAQRATRAGMRRISSL